jgi:hypothetical protein
VIPTRCHKVNRSEIESVPQSELHSVPESEPLSISRAEGGGEGRGARDKNKIVLGELAVMQMDLLGNARGVENLVRCGRSRAYGCVIGSGAARQEPRLSGISR